MTVSDLFEQPCNKSNNAIKPVRYKLSKACFERFTTTGNKQCEHNLSTACQQICNTLPTCNNLCVFMCAFRNVCHAIGRFQSVKYICNSSGVCISFNSFTVEIYQLCYFLLFDHFHKTITKE
jgi:hypothetical protein